MRSRRVVLSTWGSFGDLHPYIALGLGLRSRGHEPVIATCEIYREKVQKEGLEFAILTDEITKAWTGMTTKEYKNLKGLKKANLRDNMTNLELVLNMLAETATTEISGKREPKNFDENKTVAREGGSVAGNARKEIESKTGKKAITAQNTKTLHAKKEQKKLKR